MLSNSAGGRFGEMGALLDAGEMAWSLATHSRGILELCAGLFRVYVRPFTPYTTVAVPPAAALQMYASAHLEMIAAAFSGKTLADTYLALDSTDADRQAAAHHMANQTPIQERLLGPLALNVDHPYKCRSGTQIISAEPRRAIIEQCTQIGASGAPRSPGDMGRSFATAGRRSRGRCATSLLAG